MDQFIVSELQNVFHMDQLATSHPVYIPVNHPDEINEIFDQISYAKVGQISLIQECDCMTCLTLPIPQDKIFKYFFFQGASVVRMIQSVIGEDTFRKGLEVSIHF